MTYETKILLKAVAFLVGLAAALICAGLLATSCDGSQFECGRLDAIQPNMSAICNGYVAGQPACSVTPALNPFPVRVVSSVATFSRTSLSMRTESGDDSTSRLAVGASDPAAEFHKLPTMNGAVGATGKSSSSETGISRAHCISGVFRSERLPGAEVATHAKVEKVEGVSTGNWPRTSIKPDMWLLKNTAKSHRPLI